MTELINMPHQEAFDLVTVALRDQGRASMDRSGLCQYRADSGDRCAAGYLVPDSAYRDGMEGKLADEIGVFHDDLLPLVCAMQTAHDEALVVGLEMWEEHMAQIAKDFGLVYTAEVA